MKLECGSSVLEHPGDRPVHKALGVHLVDIVSLDRRERGGKLVVMSRDVLLGRHHLPTEQPAKHREQHDGTCTTGKRRDTAHGGMLSGSDPHFQHLLRPYALRRAGVGASWLIFAPVTQLR